MHESNSNDCVEDVLLISDNVDLTNDASPAPVVLPATLLLLCILSVSIKNQLS